MSEGMQARLKKIIEELCNEMYIHILKIWTEEDHVHMYINMPVSQPIPYVVKRLKWISSKKLREEYEEELKKYYWEPVLWAVWYFICTVWEITDEVVRKYIEEQWRKEVLEGGLSI